MPPHDVKVVALARALQEAKSPSHIHSGHAKPDFQYEYLVGIAEEAMPLMARHHEEVEPGIPFQPAWAEIFRLNALGFVRILTARDDGVLVGYIFTRIVPCLYSAGTLQAFVDAYYLAPTYRSGWTAYQMFRENERLLRDLKVKRVFIAAEESYKKARAGLLFRRLGFHRRSQSYMKVMR